MTPRVTRRARRGARWLPALAWMAGIAYLSHQTRPLGAAGSDIEAAVAHLTLYAILAFALYWPLAPDAPTPGWLPASFAFALAVLFGVTDELHHALVPGRVASTTDLALDGAGALLGVVAALVVSGVLRQLQPHSGPNP
ncbi:MAG: VanZ family protein [Dehalococcoidia bacterium]